MRFVLSTSRLSLKCSWQPTRSYRLFPLTARRCFFLCLAPLHLCAYDSTYLHKIKFRFQERERLKQKKGERSEVHSTVPFYPWLYNGPRGVKHAVLLHTVQSDPGTNHTSQSCTGIIALLSNHHHLEWLITKLKWASPRRSSPYLSPSTHHLSIHPSLLLLHERVSRVWDLNKSDSTGATLGEYRCTMRLNKYTAHSPAPPPPTHPLPPLFLLRLSHLSYRITLLFSGINRPRFIFLPYFILIFTFSHSEGIDNRCNLS